MKEKNIGGYDKNYKYDRKAVNYLEGVLLESELIIPHIESGDKLPNLDGYLELCKFAERKVIPVGRFDVQVKSLNHDYSNNNVSYNSKYSYKYSCDTKVVNVVLEAQTCNPVILILVDSKNKHIFWKYMSMQYCLKLDVETQVEKTVYFDESDEITDSNVWYDILHNIYIKFSYVQQHGDENYFLLSDKERKVPITVQNMSDYLNNILDNELWFIKQVYFQDTWKIGIAYLDGDKDSFSCIGLYKIKKGENDLFIKQFKEKAGYFWNIHYGGSYSIEDIIRQTLEIWINDFFKRDNYFLFLFPDVVLNELFFQDIDSAIAISEMGDKKKKHVELGWRGTKFSMEEFDDLVENIQENQRILSIRQELQRRGINPICRPWEKIIDYHISKQDEHCIEYKEDFDREKVDRNNMVQFLKRFEEFFIANQEKFGSCSEKVFELNNTYVLIVDDNMEGYTYGVKESKIFSLEFYIKSENESLYEEIINSFQSVSKKYIRSGSGILIPSDYSWYKLWRIINRNLFLNYIGVKENHSIAIDYMASM